MSIKLSKEEYQKRIRGDIVAVQNCMRNTPEREHIIQVLEWSVGQLYGNTEKISMADKVRIEVYRNKALSKQ